MNQELILTVGILIGAAFIPSLVYLKWIRNAEKFNRQSWRSVGKSFLWGAGFAVIMAVILSFVFLSAISQPYLQREYTFLREKNIQTLILVCVIAPIVEEFAKVLGVYSARGAILELEDGIIFGAAAGLGFAATENLLYESTTYFQEGLIAFISIVIVRSVASTLLHGSASAVAGYGISKGTILKTHSFLPYYLVAVIMHGSFNYLASIQLFYGGNIPLLGLITALIFSITAITIVRKKIIKLDRTVKRY